MSCIHRYKQIINILLLPAICWLFFNAVYYEHLHKVSSGITITHAHPYEKPGDCSSMPYASHTHTENEFIIYDIISNIILHLIITVFIAAFLFNELLNNYRVSAQEELQKQELFLIQKYRGPPNTF